MTDADLPGDVSRWLLLDPRTWIAGTYTLYMFHRMDNVEGFVEALRREDLDTAIEATGMSESQFHTRTTRVRKLWGLVGDRYYSPAIDGKQGDQTNE